MTSLKAIVVMWVVILAAVVLLIDNPEVRVGMLWIAAGTTAGVLLGSWVRARRA